MGGVRERGGSDDEATGRGGGSTPPGQPKGVQVHSQSRARGKRDGICRLINRKEEDKVSRFGLAVKR